MTDTTPDTDDLPKRRNGKERCNGGPSVNGCRRMFKDHAPRAKWCWVCDSPMEHHRDGEQAIEVEGLARMARARQAAGTPLTDRDNKALRLSGERVR